MILNEYIKKTNFKEFHFSVNDNQVSPYLSVDILDIFSECRIAEVVNSNPTIIFSDKSTIYEITFLPF